MSENKNMNTVESNFRTTGKKVWKTKAKSYQSRGSCWVLTETIQTCSTKNGFLESHALKASTVKWQSTHIPWIELWSTSQSTSWLTPWLSLSFLYSPELLIISPVANLLVYPWVNCINSMQVTVTWPVTSRTHLQYSAVRGCSSYGPYWQLCTHSAIFCVLTQRSLVQYCHPTLCEWGRSP